MNSFAQIVPTQLVQQILTMFPDTQAIYLFGSYAAGTVSPQSDVDIAVLLPSHHLTEAVHWWQLQERLVNVVNRQVDLINMRQVSTVFQMEIIRTGQRIFCHQLPVCNEYEALTISLYQKLNEERSAIITAIRETGIIYG